MFTVVCALPAAAAAVVVIPSAIAQEVDNGNLPGSIVSEVLEGDSSSDAEDESNQDATNTATEDSNQQQDVDEDNVGEFGDDTADLEDANVAVPLGIPINVLEEVVEETLTPPPPSPDDDELPPEEPSEFVAFCYDNPDILRTLHCYDTLEDCELGRGFFGAEDECEGVETVPPNAFDCAISRNSEGEPEGASCVLDS
jgi:hypothetical protein